jgi:pimeloyl-ACP methyl ester carboxylesterase
VGLLVAASALLVSGCGGRSAAGELHHRLLAAGDLPAGWSAAPTSTGLTPTHSSCLSGMPKSPKGWTYESAAYVQGVSIPNVGEVLASGAQAQQAWSRFDHALARCRTTTLVFGTTKVRATIRPVSLPRIGRSSSAYAWTFTLAGIRLGFDLVLFHTGTYDGYLSYADLGSPKASTVTAFARAAAAKATKGATTPVPDSVSIASVPVQTANTTHGTVAYRSLGSGSPLVLITGYGGTMEGWDPRFVDALARRHRVVLFDNAGIGQTSPLPAPLGIDAMADQTSGLIAALGLGRTSVLGWSMGSMIAQALAVRHPAQVRRLIVCASFPGDGTTTRPSQSAIDGFESGNEQKVMADLFPAGQTGAQSTYLAAISSYPAAAPPPAGVLTEQSHAVDEWWAGTDPAGKRTAALAVPTLIADGAADRLDPVANSHALARLIPGSTLRLYPDAGHAFLFQDGAVFLRLVESFLG